MFNTCGLVPLYSSSVFASRLKTFISPNCTAWPLLAITFGQWHAESNQKMPKFAMPAGAARSASWTVSGVLHLASPFAATPVAYPLLHCCGVAANCVAVATFPFAFATSKGPVPFSETCSFPLGPNPIMDCPDGAAVSVP